MKAVSRPQCRRLVATAILFVYALGCTSWHVVSPAPADYVQTHRPSSVQVTRTEGSRIVLHTPERRGDTLFGMVGGGLAQADSFRHVRIPLADVQTMEVRQFSPSKTLGLSLAVFISLSVAGGIALNREGW